MSMDHGRLLGCTPQPIRQSFPVLADFFAWVWNSPTGHSPPTMTTGGFCANACRNNSRPCTPAPTTAALPVQFPGPLYILRNFISLKLWVLTMSDPKPVERPMNS
ncbi:hypothetical protein PMIN03_000547 [Paraphaeosphaeria minitans]